MYMFMTGFVYVCECIICAYGCVFGLGVSISTHTCAHLSLYIYIYVCVCSRLCVCVHVSGCVRLYLHV